MESASEKMYEYWFAVLKGISGRRKSEIRKAYPSAESVYNIEETAIKKGILSQKEYQFLADGRDMEQLKRDCDQAFRNRIRFCTISDVEYPDKLKNIYCPPYALFYIGRLPEQEESGVAVVGARECTYYGMSVAKEIGELCAMHHVPVVSGMARGVDGISQGSALNAGGKSYAVLGCGVDVCYPTENRKLYERVQEQGGLISEYAPGTAPLANHFPARNRIISALAEVLVVVEAREKSGSLITADFALDQGKTVYAVPGPVTSAVSRGCNRLIKQGAEVFLSAEEMLDECGLNRGSETVGKEKNEIKLETKEKLVYSCLNLMPQTADEIQRKTQIDASEIMAILTSLEMKDCAEAWSGNYFVKKEQGTVVCS